MKSVLETARIDLIVLDLMLPGEDGLTLTRDLRGAHNDIPIIMLTARGDEMDRIVGLEMGADDYLPKPFNPRELLARIKSVLHRANNLPVGNNEGRATKLIFGGWTLDLAKRQFVSPGGVNVALSSGEFDLLVVFAEHPQRVLSRDQLLDLSRGRAASLFDRSVDVQVGRLRRKIEEDPKHPAFITTVRGCGYFFTPSVEKV